MADARVPMAVVLSAFGVAVTVTRPAPDDTPIETTGAWVTPINDNYPVGPEFQRRHRRQVLVLSRDEVPTVPKGTLIDAPARDGDDERRWRVDGIDEEDADHFRVLVVEEP